MKIGDHLTNTNTCQIASIVDVQDTYNCDQSQQHNSAGVHQVGDSEN